MSSASRLAVWKPTCERTAADGALILTCAPARGATWQKHRAHQGWALMARLRLVFVALAIVMAAAVGWEADPEGVR